MPAFRAIFCLTLVAGIGIGVGFGCQKPRASKTLDTSGAKAPVGLDVNDVSILFPLPASAEAIPKMLSVNFVNADGQSPLTPAIFESMLKAHDQEIVVEGKKVNLSSGSKFDGKGRQTGGSRKDFGPYNQIADWKIIAMRFDPCAPTPVHNLQGKGLASPRDRFDPNACLIQLRLTAQPVLDGKREVNSSEIKVAVGDYAIHMLFALNADAARKIYGELLAFKQECGDLTSSIPLMKHPCLVKENKATGIEGPFHQRIQSLIKGNAKQLVGVAMLATHNGDDPWTFMNGFIENGQFKQKQIAAVTKDDPATFTRGQNGNLLEPFANGFFQMVAFLGVSGQAADSVRVSPSMVPGKANTFLLNEYNMTVTDTPAAFSKIAAIENPLRNDFFSTDCASCHAAQHIFSRLALASSRDVRRNGKDTGRSSDFLDGGADTIEKWGKIWNQSDLPEAFQHDGPYSHASNNDTRISTDRGGTSFPTSFVHFGYIVTEAKVSQRVINESILAAKMANAFYGEGREPPVRCAQAELKQCMAEHAINEFNMYRNHLQLCLAEVCSERSLELWDNFARPRDYLGGRVRHFRVKKQIETPDLRIKVGTNFFGGFRPALDKENKSWVIDAQNYAEAESLSGEKLFIKWSWTGLTMMLSLEANPSDYFEEIGLDKKPTIGYDMLPPCATPSDETDEKGVKLTVKYERGWCRIVSLAAANKAPTCRDASTDRDAKGIEDGWGWEDGHSCVVKK